MTRIRVRKGVRVMVGDAHKAFGLWSIWFLFLMIITSIWYLAEFGAAVSGVRFEPNRPGVAVEQLELYGNVINAHSTQDIVDAAQSAFPELNITTIRFPTRATQAITVLGKTGNPLLRSRANRVFLKPHTLEPIKIQRSENIGWVAWLNEIADPLHFGFFGGLITKLIWFFFGIALTALSFTGVWLTWKRTKTKAISRAQFATMPVLFIALLFGYFWWYQRYVPVGLPHSERILESIQQERIAITPHLGITENNEFTGKVRFLMTTENGLPNIKKASVLLVGANEKNHTTSPKVRVQRFARLSLLTFSVNPEKFNEALKLTLQLEMNSKETLSFSWPLHSVEPASLSAL